jgi:glycosyltransferase involved in cell wall biosynthesis
VATDKAPLLVFSDDWGRHPSSCQHLIRHLVQDQPVYWVNTIGTRPPRLDWATLKRGWEKARHWTRPAPPKQALPPNLRLLSPYMWPTFRTGFARGLNRRLLLGQLGSALRSLPRPPVAITTLPIVADLIGELPVSRWVYYCVDDFALWPGLDQTVLGRMDEELIRKADTLIAASDTLRQKIEARGRQSHLLTHGVDLEFWRRAAPVGAIPALEGLERPLLVFWGVLDRRMDVRFVQALAESSTRGTIVLVGPEADPDPKLMKLPRTVHVPPLAFEQLPLLAREAGVLIMPYGDLPVTRAMQPLKLKEYLATGKPVVVRDLPANREWQGCLDLVSDPQSFARRVLLRAQTGVPEEQLAARSRLSRESWRDKAQLFKCWAGLEGEGVSRPRSGERDEGTGALAGFGGR